MRGLKQMFLQEQKYLENIVNKAKAGLSTAPDWYLRISKDKKKSDIMENENLNVTQKDDYSNERLNKTMAQKTQEYCAKYGITEEEVFNISSAGSTPVGMLGYEDCVKEIASQSCISYDYIFCGNGSGGTYGGMLLGSEIYMPSAKVIGVAIEEMNPYKPQFILNLIKKRKR